MIEYEYEWCVTWHSDSVSISSFDSNDSYNCSDLGWHKISTCSSFFLFSFSFFFHFFLIRKGMQSTKSIVSHKLYLLNFIFIFLLIKVHFNENQGKSRPLLMVFISIYCKAAIYIYILLEPANKLAAVIFNGVDYNWPLVGWTGLIIINPSY